MTAKQLTFIILYSFLKVIGIILPLIMVCTLISGMPWGMALDGFIIGGLCFGGSFLLERYNSTVKGFFKD